MPHLNIEVKARCNQPEFIREYLQKNDAILKGTDIQTDTYFNVSNGRLKLREGNIENSLIWYARADVPGVKESNFELVQVPAAEKLKDVLTRSLGVKIIVQKTRQIWFIKNAKFHIDEIQGLGSFVEIEASNLYAHLAREELKQQCDFYMGELGISSDDLLSVSYSDMLLSPERKS
ncbi:MAG TPA: class IV adenylate cyclase [Chitinophagaceae bacterium]